MISLTCPAQLPPTPYSPPSPPSPSSYHDLFKPASMSTEDPQQPLADAGVDDLANNYSRVTLEPRTEEEYAQAQITLRAIVTSKEAGVIIGKSGKNVADLRDETGVRAGVSKVVPGVQDRVLTVTGPLEGIGKAYCIVARSLLEGAPAMGMGGIVTATGTHRM